MADFSLTGDLDASQIENELQKLPSKFAAAGKKSAEAAQAGHKDGGGHGNDLDDLFGQKGLFNSHHRVANQVGNVAKEFASGAGAAALFGTAVEGVERSLNLPLGSLAGLAVIGVLAERIGHVYAEAKKAREEMDNLLAQPHGDAQLSTLSELTSHLAEVKKKSEEAEKIFGRFENPTNKILRTIGENFVDPDGHEKAQYEFERNKRRAHRLEESLSEDIAEKQGKTAEIAETKLTKGDFAAERIKAEQDDLERRKKLTTDTSPHELGVNLDRQYAAELGAIDKKEEAQNRAVALERELVDIKNRGRDVDVESAKAKLEYARQEVQAANEQERPGKLNKLAAADAELAQVQRVTEAKNAQITLETQIANIQGTADQKRAAALAGERASLEKRLADAQQHGRGDEARTLERDLAKNLDAQRQFDTQRENREFKTRETEIDADTGRGQLEQINALVAKLDNNATHIANLKKNPLVDNLELAQAEGHLNTLKKSLEDIRDARRDSHDAADADLAASQADAHGDSFRAGIIRSAQGAQKGIRQAVKDQDPELAQVREQTSETSLIGSLARQNIQRRNETPQQRSAREKAERDQSQEHERETDRINRSLAPQGRTALDGGSRPVLTKEEQAIADRIRGLRNTALGKDEAGGKGNGLEKTNTILDKIEKNTQDLGANK